MVSFDHFFDYEKKLYQTQGFVSREIASISNKTKPIRGRIYGIPQFAIWHLGVHFGHQKVIVNLFTYFKGNIFYIIN